jgi:hypothetical protein
MLQVSLDCFLIAPSVFFNVYFQRYILLYLFYHFIQQQFYYEVINIQKLVIIHCVGQRPSGIVQLISNSNIFINTKVKLCPASYDRCIKNNNASEVLIFVNTGLEYGQTCKCVAIK